MQTNTVETKNILNNKPNSFQWNLVRNGDNRLLVPLEGTKNCFFKVDSNDQNDKFEFSFL